MDQNKRPTIRDVAAEANVSVATVNRVLSGAGAVRQGTRERVRLAAEQIGFYGMGAMRSRIAAARPRYRFGFLLHQPGRAFYRNIADALRAAAPTMPDCEIELRIEFLDDLSPQNVAARMLALGAECDAVGVVAAVHPLVTQAVDALQCPQRAGLRADLADLGNGPCPLYRARQLEGRAHRGLGVRACLQGARQARHPRRQPSLPLPGDERKRLSLLFPRARA